MDVIAERTAEAELIVERTVDFFTVDERDSRLAVLRVRDAQDTSEGFECRFELPFAALVPPLSHSAP